MGLEAIWKGGLGGRGVVIGGTLLSDLGGGLIGGAPGGGPGG